MYIRLHTITLALACITGVPACAQNVHPGTVIDRASGSPISIEITAWSSNTGNISNANSCQLDGKILDSTTSDPADGEFVSSVPTAEALYSLVYCGNGYHPAVMKHLRNTASGDPTIPRPMRMQPIPDGIDTAEATDIAIFALNQLAYLRSIDSGAFDGALKEHFDQISDVDGSAGEAFFNLIAALQNWSGS
ncbi:hypothetical protein KUV47_12390 [Vannielia litorea]|uniref:hypothetical protein n=1 Tax=Vannielia litorea TaxID=1217970 RepID=UPI001C945ABD|nr:hypothetical protein [Vannielia litorea]MBY6154015.1 hypothetical protein [Vannielia litorea]